MKHAHAYESMHMDVTVAFWFRDTKISRAFASRSFPIQGLKNGQKVKRESHEKAETTRILVTLAVWLTIWHPTKMMITKWQMPTNFFSFVIFLSRLFLFFFCLSKDLNTLCYLFSLVFSNNTSPSYRKQTLESTFSGWWKD